MTKVEEHIVYVDESGIPTGETAPKVDAHTSNTKLHLAFSCYIFDENGKFLATQRAHTKKVWPGVWTNSVCGHPAPGEAIEDAIARRLKDELGMAAKDFKIVLPSYRYKTPPFKGIIENEFCPVFVARAKSKPNPNHDEVEAIRWMNWNDYVKAAEADSADVWSWWCKDQLKQLKEHDLIKNYSHSN